MIKDIETVKRSERDLIDLLDLKDLSDLKVGERLSRLPCKDLSLLELSEAYAYCLLTYGRNHFRTSLVRDEIEKRDPKVPKHNYYQQGVGYSNSNQDYDYNDWDYKYDGRD